MTAEHLDLDDRISTLADSFPTLRFAPGVRLWDSGTLDEWANGPDPGDGARHAARFVLAVWDNGTQWQSGRFDVVEALAVWDHEHKRAFRAWADEPWWA